MRADIKKIILYPLIILFCIIIFNAGIVNALPITLTFFEDNLLNADARAVTDSLTSQHVQKNGDNNNWFISFDVTLAINGSLNIENLFGRHLKAPHPLENEPNFNINVESFLDINNLNPQIKVPTEIHIGTILHNSPTNNHYDRLTVTLSDLDPSSSSFLSPTGGFQMDFSLSHVPEPSTYLLLLLGLIGMVGVKKKFS